MPRLAGKVAYDPAHWPNKHTVCLQSDGPPPRWGRSALRFRSVAHLYGFDLD
jgi:hypothetical protein